MNVVLTKKTQRLLQQRMKHGHYSSPDEAIRIALETLVGEPFEKLDPELQAEIERADEQCDRGEGIPVDEAFARLRRKHFGK